MWRIGGFSSPHNRVIQANKAVSGLIQAEPIVVGVGISWTNI